MNYEQLVDQISQIHVAAQTATAKAANHYLTLRNWRIGAYLFEYEQNGEDRAKYGAQVLQKVATEFSRRGIKGLSFPNLKNFRQFALAYPGLAIGYPLVSQFGLLPEGSVVDERNSKTRQVRAGNKVEGHLQHFPSLAARHAQQESLPWQNPEYYAGLFRSLSWTHLMTLARIDTPLKRAFYEIECQKSRWSRRELKRQINSMLYERIGLSKNKDAVLKLAAEGQLIESPETIIRDPYILEFLGLEEKAEYSEAQLEQALIDHLQQFILELGREFCFVARQFRITVANRHHYLDLLFFHRGLRCLLALDLKLGEFQHEDAGQMNFYLNYLREEIMLPSENPPVGLILCAEKDAAEVHFATAGMDQQLFVSRYLDVLPSAERLRQWLLEEQELLQRRKET